MPGADTNPVSIAAGGEQRVLPARGASKARLLVPAALLVILLFLVAGPVLQFAASSFEKADGGSFTLANYTVAFANARRLQALVNSLLIGSAATA